MSQPFRNAQGFSLIEGMLAATILSIGLLALIGMQGQALGRNADAQQLTMATNFVSHMVERITYNRSHVAAYHGIDTTEPTTQPASTEPMARGDYQQWRTTLTSSTLHNARGTITVALQDQDPTLNPSSLGRRLVTVTVSWNGPNQNGASRVHAVTVSTIITPE